MPRPTSTTPEDQEIYAKAYLQYGSFDKAARGLGVKRWKIVKAYYRINGRCDCGASLTGTFLSCDRCRLRSSTTRNNIAIRRKSNGLCVTCGEPRSDKSKVYCDTHLEINKDQQIYRRTERKSNLLCVSCGNPLDNKSIRLCNKCLESKLITSKKSKFDGLYNTILERDNFKCVICHNDQPRLEVHHLYNENSMESLVTLCLKCHHAITALKYCDNVLGVFDFIEKHTV